MESLPLEMTFDMKSVYSLLFALPCIIIVLAMIAYKYHSTIATLIERATAADVESKERQ